MGVGEILMRAFVAWMEESIKQGILANLRDLFGLVNEQVGNIAHQVGQTPQGWHPEIFNMIQGISNTVILPIAGLVLSFTMTLELIQLIMDKNNGHEIGLEMLFKWIFKSMFAILIVSNTWNIVMAVFDVSQQVVHSAAGIVSSANLDAAQLVTQLEPQLAGMDLWTLIALWVLTMLLQTGMWVIAIIIFVVTYGRMLEIYLMTSLAPVPMATMMGKEMGSIGQNYMKSLVALGFQGFLIIVCVAIYSVMVRGLVVGDNIFVSILYYVGYTVLLCFTLTKTSSLSKSIFNAH